MWFPSDGRGVCSPYTRPPHVPHLQHDLRFLSGSAVRVCDNRARLRVTVHCGSLLVISALNVRHFCQMLMGWLDDAVDQARHTHTYARDGDMFSLSINHAYLRHADVVEKRLWAKLNLHKRPDRVRRFARPLARDLCSSSNEEIAIVGHGRSRENSPTSDDRARFLAEIPREIFLETSFFDAFHFLNHPERRFRSR